MDADEEKYLRSVVGFDNDLTDLLVAIETVHPWLDVSPKVHADAKRPFLRQSVEVALAPGISVFFFHRRGPHWIAHTVLFNPETRQTYETHEAKKKIPDDALILVWIWDALANTLINVASHFESDGNPDAAAAARFVLARLDGDGPFGHARSEGA